MPSAKIKRTDLRWIAAFDNHGDMQDDAAVNIMFEFMKMWRPEIRIHGGDCFDVRALRGAGSQAEQRESFLGDLAAGLAFIDRFKPTHFLRGNHDERIWDGTLHHVGVERDFCIQQVTTITDRLGDIPILPYNKRTGVLEIGKLKVVHGYSTGISAAKTAAQVYGAVLMGHIHAIDHYSIPGLKVRIGRACGCLCKLDQDYNARQIQTLRQEHGFAYGILNEHGLYQMYQAQPIGRRWYFPTEVISFHG